ncbi:HAMP domain-containing sensor histidine kinase [Acaryochloris sp. IP29b_bin.137]|uniref:sensor histidine kinase n=1 Tax=Acaryochloris sp. IP29b_bin.137 TaxID=2969217 RepID=UPI0026169C9E|nr:HAMP domain-containing sensor histidine kinase [Acaryochloris sp. IP29b_bin.137]
MNAWVLPTVGEGFQDCEPNLDWWSEPQSRRSETEWHVAIGTLLSLLLAPQEKNISQPSGMQFDPGQRRGLILTGPTPLFSDLGLFAHFHTWALVPTNNTALRLPPCERTEPEATSQSAQTIPLLPADPQLAERFCLVLTAAFCWVAVLKPSANQGGCFQFSFIPETVHQVLQNVRSRIQLMRPHHLQAFDMLLQQWPTQAPHYHIPQQFSRQLLQNYQHVLPLKSEPAGKRSARPPEKKTTEPSGSGRDSGQDSAESRSHPKGPEVDLLKALAHEVRTPLTTIQTFTQLLLKRSDLPAEVLKRLESIRRECHEQIDRFSLIFRAMELTTAETKPTVQLRSISVQEVLKANVVRWQKQADRRSLSFELDMPEQLPAIATSDPNMFEQVLTDLIEQLSHRLPMGSHMQLQIALAGDQLKLELRSDQTMTHSESVPDLPMLKAIGDLLMLQPETGNLSLSLPVTKQLFELLGGKLIVRQNQHQGEVLTIFLPLGTDSTAY